MKNLAHNITHPPEALIRTASTHRVSHFAGLQLRLFRSKTGEPPKILFLVSEDHSFCARRLASARMLRDLGAEIWVMTRLQNCKKSIESEGFKIIPWSVSRKSLNPFLETRALLQVLSAYRRLRPDLVHHFSLKASIYGGIAARLCGCIPSASTIPGLGHTFTNQSLKIRTVRPLVIALLRFSFGRQNVKVIFQNSDNLDVFIQERVVDRQQSVLIRGSGVDCVQFSPQPEPLGVPVVLFAGRMLWEKGLAEFIAAARILREENVSARFVLVGEPDLDHTSSIPQSTLRDWVAAGHVEWWGNRDDMPEIFAQSNVVCLPSYGEGVPKSLIEAAACGRALVACDVPGCREIVHHGENGFLVHARDADALARAIATLVAQPSLRAQMGVRGRAIALDGFSEQLVLSQMLAVYQQLLRDSASGPTFTQTRLSIY